MNGEDSSSQQFGKDTRDEKKRKKEDKQSQAFIEKRKKTSQDKEKEDQIIKMDITETIRAGIVRWGG
ncbi:MAG: hypothetical protein EZS28_052644, partial [Streblomastix strix]